MNELQTSDQELLRLSKQMESEYDSSSKSLFQERIITAAAVQQTIPEFSRLLLKKLSF